MKDIIQLPGYMNEFGNIMMIKFKILQFKEVFNIFQIPCNKIIHTYYIKSFLYEAVTKMRSKKPCSPGNQNAPPRLLEGGTLVCYIISIATCIQFD